jgi:hypothetical protein
LECTQWNHTAEWGLVGCDTDGTNCVLIIEVTNSSDCFGDAGCQASLNILPFVPPKQMLGRLPFANVTATVGDKPSGNGEQVPITLKASATAMYVVLTTAAPGRFSDNAILIEGGQSVVVDFISWDGPMNATGLELLKSSLRVEHLADNL